MKQLKSDGIVWRFNDAKYVRAIAFENKKEAICRTQKPKQPTTVIFILRDC